MDMAFHIQLVFELPRAEMKMNMIDFEATLREKWPAMLTDIAAGRNIFENFLLILDKRIKKFKALFCSQFGRLFYMALRDYKKMPGHKPRIT